DSRNCGGCGNDCQALPHVVATSCSKGACSVAQCEPGRGNCDQKGGNGCESDLGTDLLHCGACGNACPAPPHVQPTGVGGSCGLGGCQAPWIDCNHDPKDGCEASLDDDPVNCGACGVVCPAAFHAPATCVKSACTVACDAGWGDCDKKPGNGCEIDLCCDCSKCRALRNGRLVGP